jgi:DNA-binding response OmpR family regulator
MKRGLELHGFRVDAYNDPAEAIKAFRPGTYDLVLLDIQMPRTNGFDVYRELRKIDGKVAICFLTALEIFEEEFSRLFPGIRISKFLKKPISIDALIHEVQQLTSLTYDNHQ